MIYMLGIVVVALRLGRGPSLLAAVLSVLSFDFFFVPPFYSFAVADFSHVVTFGVMLFVALVISSLVQRSREHADAAVAVANERATLAKENENRRVEVETERLRTALLSSVSHDLRTPLAVMTGAASTLLDPVSANLAESERNALLRTIYDEGERLGRVIRNLLDITRLESGSVQPSKEWCPIEEVVVAALSRVQSWSSPSGAGTAVPSLRGRDVRVDVDRSLSAPIDFVLVEQLLVNVLENAAKYADSRGPIEIGARKEGERIVVEVADRGPGFAPGDEARVFEKFYRGKRDETPAGAGLGLAIAKAIAIVHGGTLTARNRDGGGAIFALELPVKGTRPAPPAEMEAS
jgi:two-component system sensor histidine kinase KdpD